MSTLSYTVEFVLLSCGKCGIHFAVPGWWNEEHKKTHAVWYCPNGHGREYATKTEIDIEREAAKAAQAVANDERHKRIVAEKERDKILKEKKRIEARVSHGVCPCCNRTFENLARHMKIKHKGELLGPGHQKAIAAPNSLASTAEILDEIEEKLIEKAGKTA